MEQLKTSYQTLEPEDMQQSYKDTCAIKAQQIILNHKGIFVSEDQLVEEAIEHGWYSPGGGTCMTDVGKLLELYGLDVERSLHSSIEDIAESLIRGQSVIVAVDSGELWNPSPLEEIEDLLWGPHTDHVVIARVVAVNPLTGEQEVMLTDTGTGEVIHFYEMDTFLDAWEHSNYFMLTIL